MERTRDEAHSTAHRPTLCEQSVTRLWRSTLLLNSKAPEQMTAEWPLRRASKIILHNNVTMQRVLDQGAQRKGCH